MILPTMRLRLARLEARVSSSPAQASQPQPCTPEAAAAAYQQFMQDHDGERIDFPTDPRDAAAAYVRLVKGNGGLPWRG